MARNARLYPATHAQKASLDSSRQPEVFNVLHNIIRANQSAAILYKSKLKTEASLRYPLTIASHQVGVGEVTEDAVRCRGTGQC
jgi:hypothetical protein